ncbi:unnamed protein product [Coregonus sp. 'balchen']|nr:unnamed protein product [Coregonus sp. 'balchen']
MYSHREWLRYSVYFIEKYSRHQLRYNMYNHREWLRYSVYFIEKYRYSLCTRRNQLKSTC